ncbi:MAG: hypothetical protein QW461_04035 [Candidatus Jordarchaeales archaeon]
MEARKIARYAVRKEGLKVKVETRNFTNCWKKEKELKERSTGEANVLKLPTRK